MFIDFSIFFLFFSHLLIEIILMTFNFIVNDIYYGNIGDRSVLVNYKFSNFYFNVLFNFIITFIAFFFVNAYDLVKNNKYKGIDLTILNGDSDDLDDSDNSSSLINDTDIIKKELPIKFILYLDVIRIVKESRPLDTNIKLLVIKKIYEKALKKYTSLDGLNIYDKKDDIIEYVKSSLNLYNKKLD